MPCDLFGVNPCKTLLQHDYGVFQAHRTYPFELTAALRHPPV
jgi:hypothetical protein